LNALLDGFRLSGRIDFLTKADEIVRRCIHPHDDLEALDLLDAERRWFYTVFLQALARYLDEKRERGEIDPMYDYGCASLLHYARWMAAHEYPYLEKPEILEYPTETWAAQDLRKSDLFVCAAVYADRAERERFLERAAFFHRSAIETLVKMPTRTFTRPLVLLLTNGWAYRYARRYGCSEILPGDTVKASSLPPPSAFVPQKDRVIRRARLAAGAAAVVAILAALAAWIN
jgi:hypothetical protein